ncbi:MAG: Holliday junction branch migration protein RuvA [Patescibacteria group bacterium]|nr:Holliday junction branch migration protein RuvA [Patescibacteria group bacterium]
MIAYLKGVVKTKREKDIVLVANGVGYRVHVLPAVIEAAVISKDLELHTHLHQTENASELYGFASLEELGFFEHLIAISGVGPKSAIGILSTAPVRDIQLAIVQNDSSLLTRVSGIGRKTAERIIIELREKLEKLGIVGEAGNEDFADALEALVHLGYTRVEARHALTQIGKEIKDPQARVKAALRILGRK